MFKISKQNVSIINENLDKINLISLTLEELKQLSGGMKGKVKWFNAENGCWEIVEVDL